MTIKELLTLVEAARIVTYEATEVKPFYLIFQLFSFEIPIGDYPRGINTHVDPLMMIGDKEVARKRAMDYLLSCLTRALAFNPDKPHIVPPFMYNFSYYTTVKLEDAKVKDWKCIYHSQIFNFRLSGKYDSDLLRYQVYVSCAIEVISTEEFKKRF